MKSYQNLCADYYDLDKPIAPDEALKFYLEYIEKANGPILEPMCGNGRFLVPFLERGFNVEGLDASMHMLGLCMQKCADKNIKPVLYPQYLNEMSLEKQYNLIFIPSGSIGLITNKDQVLLCLKNIYDRLMPNGTFVFEIETIHAIPKQLGIWEGKIHEKTDGAQILLSTLPRYNPEKQILQVMCRYELIKNSQIISTEMEDLRTRLYQHEEMDNWLTDVGFKDIMRYKVYGRAEPDEQDEAIVYECKKY